MTARGIYVDSSVPAESLGGILVRVWTANNKFRHAKNVPTADMLENLESYVFIVLYIYVY